MLTPLERTIQLARIGLPLSGETQLILLGVILFGCIVGWYFSRQQVVKRKLRKMPHKPVGEYQEGECGRIMGQVRVSGHSFNAPLSGRKCAYYYVLVQELHISRRSWRWDTIIEEEKGGDVLIQDGNHYALILTKTIRSWIDQDVKYRSGTFKNATPNLKSYLEKHQQSSEGCLGLNRDLRYKEGAVEENEILTVSGKVTWRKASELGYNLPGDKILVVGPETHEPVYMTDAVV